MLASAVTAEPDALEIETVLDANQQLGFAVGGDHPTSAVVTFENVKSLPCNGTVRKDETVRFVVTARVEEVAFRGTERRHFVTVESVVLERPERTQRRFPDIPRSES